MKKSPSQHKIQDQVSSIQTPYPFCERKQPSKIGPVSPLRGARHQVNYIPGETPNTEPPELPRLFIQGLGGSIKMDLSGLGIELLPQASAFCMPDDSLQYLGVHRGDIAIVQPLERDLQAGDLLLVDLSSHATLRRVTKVKTIWCLELPGERDCELLSMYEQPFMGVAVGFLRVFEAIKPANYPIQDSVYRHPYERHGSATGTKGLPSKAGKMIRRRVKYRNCKKARGISLTEGALSLRLSEIS